MSKKYICYFIFLTIVLCFIGTYCGIANYDTVWQYINIKKIVDGCVIYRDFNCVATPFFYYIMAIFTFVLLPFVSFTTAFISARTILCCLFGMIVYGYFKTYNIKPSICFLYSAVISSYYSLFGFVEYNTLAVMLAFTALLVIVTKYNFRYKYSKEIILGLLLFLIVFTKQTIGGIYSILLCGLYLYQNQRKKNVWIVLCTALTCGGIYLFYLYFNNSLSAFWDYCVSGLFEFNKYNNNIISDKYKGEGEDQIFAVVFAVTTILQSIFLFFLSIRKKEQRKNLLGLGIILLGTFCCVYPIFNSGHAVIGFYIACFIVLPIELTFIPSKKKLREDSSFVKSIKKYLWLTVFTFGIGISYIFSIQAYSTCEDFGDGVYIEKKCLEENNYKKLESYVLSHPDSEFWCTEANEAAFLELKTKEPMYGNRNLYLKGNIGTKNPLDICKQWCGEKGKKNHKYIIISTLSDEEIFWQTQREYILPYIKKTYPLRASFDCWDIYQVS